MTTQDAANEYKRWFLFAQSDPALLCMLKEIAEDDALITECFYQDLQFGTGGLRGQVGAGINRMNIYTVGKATQGLAQYLLKGKAAPSVCIAYDTRNFSLEFAQTAAGVLCANGLRVHLFETTHPTPMLSFAVRQLAADCGIVITASHNPKEYNGYKVYNAAGNQITDEAAAEISAEIAACDIFEDVKLLPLEQALAGGNLSFIGPEVDDAYYAAVKGLILRKSMVRTAAAELNVLYTPLHGSGNVPVRRVLAELGFSSVSVVPEQELPDGNFPTCPYPNPEEPAVYQLAIRQAQESNPDLIFATDPDCDRIGVLTRGENGDYAVLSGNQTGALLCDYLLRSHQELGTMPPAPAVIKTIVTTELAARICAENGAEIVDVLTGFKYIGETIAAWEKDGSHRFVFGFEESYGCLAGSFVRDKDAVIAAALIAEMALYYKKNDKTLAQALEELDARYGCYREKLLAVTLPGLDGRQRIAAIMEDLRGHYREKLAAAVVRSVEDYLSCERRDLVSGQLTKINLPQADVLKFFFENGSLVLRPSGTEPKIKLYLSAFAQTPQEADAQLAHLGSLAQEILA